MGKIFKGLLIGILCIGLAGCKYSSTKSATSGKNDTDYSASIKTDDKEEKKEYVEKQKFEINDYFFNNNLRWNMSYAEADDTIPLSSKRNLDNGATKYLEYSPFTADRAMADTKYVFAFLNGNLKTYFIRFDNYHDYIDLYNEVRQKVISLYGNPTTENYNWTDETYKGNENEWNKALRYGYLTIEAQWLANNDKEVIMRWNYEAGFSLIICEKGYISSL